MKQIEGLSRREQNKVRTRVAILKAARTKFASVGIASATMDEIADAADISRATLFNYYPSKADIVAALVEQMDEDFIALIHRYHTFDGSITDRIVGIFTESARSLEARRDVARPLVGISWQSLGEDIGVARMAQLTDAFVGLLSDDSRANDVRDDVDVRLLGEMLVSIYIGLIHNWRIADAYPLESRMGAAARMIAQSVTRR